MDSRDPLMEVRGRARDAPQVLHLYIEKGSALTVILSSTMQRAVKWLGAMELVRASVQIVAAAKYCMAQHAWTRMCPV